MNNELSQKKANSRFNFEWLFQLIASLAWLISVFVYGSYELGDWLQLVAASAWTISNLLNFINQRNVTETGNQ